MQIQFEKNESNTMILTQENLEILNKEHCPSKDMLYAKIFTDFEQDSNITPIKK